MTVTIILTLIMCALLFLMIWAAAYFYPCGTGMTVSRSI